MAPRRMFAAVAFALGLLVTMLGSSASGAPVDERLAFARGSSPGQYDIWTIQNGTKHRVTRSCGWDWWPDWSPDGTRIAFGRECRARSFDIYTVGSNGAGLRRLTSGAPVDQWPAWSPNGREIVFVRGVSAGSELYVVNAAGGGLHRLTRNKVMDQAPAWSPDGQSIAFSRTIGGRNRLMLMRADGSGQRSIRSVPGGEPAWSPDGSRLAFARAVRGATRETASIYVLTLGRAGVQTVTFDRPGSVSHHPTWSADGRLIAFMSNRAALGRGASLYAVRPDGKGLHRLTRAVFEDVDPAWLRLAQ